MSTNGKNSKERTLLANGTQDKLGYITDELNFKLSYMSRVVKRIRNYVDFLLNDLCEPKYVKYLERLLERVNSLFRYLKEATNTDGATDNLINEMREKEAYTISIIFKTGLILKYCIPAVSLLREGFRLLTETLQDQLTKKTTNSDHRLCFIDIINRFKMPNKVVDIHQEYIKATPYLHKKRMRPNTDIQSKQYNYGSTRGYITETGIRNTPYVCDTTSCTCFEFNVLEIGAASSTYGFYGDCSQLLKNEAISLEDNTALELRFESFQLLNIGTHFSGSPLGALIGFFKNFSFEFSNQDKPRIANTITTTNDITNNSVVPYETSSSRIGILALYRPQDPLVPNRRRSIRNTIISYRNSTTLPYYLLLAIDKDVSSGVPRLFTRYWIVTPEMFEDALRANQLSTITLSYIVFHPNDVRLPIYIPVYQGSYLNRKDTDYRQAYSGNGFTGCTDISLGESQDDLIEYQAIEAASTETNSVD